MPRRLALLPLWIALLVGLAACGGEPVPAATGTTEPQAASPATLADGSKAAAGPDEDVRAFRRQQLLDEAEQVVGGGRLLAADATASLRALARDEKFLETPAPAGAQDEKLRAELAKTVAQRRLFLGPAPPPPAEGAVEPESSPRGGALAQAERLLLWLKGDPSQPCRIQIRRAGAEDAKAEAYPWPVPQPPPPPKKPPADEASAASEPPAPAPGDTTPAGAKEEAPPAPSPAPMPADRGEATAPADPLAPPAAGHPPEAPAPAPENRPKGDTKEDWLDWVLLKEGTLVGKDVQPVACSEVSDLERLATTPPDYLPAGEGMGKEGKEDLERFPLASTTPFAYNEPFLKLRKVQAKQRIEAWDKETATKLLVDESTVREKARRAKLYEDRLAARRAEREAVLSVLDHIVGQMDRWQNVAAALSGRIQEERLRLEAEAKKAGAANPEPTETPTPEPGDEEPPEPARSPGEGETPVPAAPLRSLKLRVLEAQETTVSMEISLIYHTALRARERLTILDALIKPAEAEAQKAESIRREYAAELARVRSSRALRRLKASREQLLALRQDFQSSKALEAADALLDLNDLVLKVVQRRNLLNEIATAKSEPTPDRPPATTATTPAAATAASGDSAPPSTAAEGPSLSPLTERIEQQPWTLETIKLARKDLGDPALNDSFDAALVARHYEVAERRAALLEAGLAKVAGDEQLRTRCDALLEKADKALADLPDWSGAKRRYAPHFEALKRDYQAAIEDLKSEKDRLGVLLGATRAYRDELLDQGPRSLAIRVNSDLQTAEVVRALEESARGIQEAGRWLGGETDPSLWDWARARWLRILGALGVLVGILLLVLFGRRWIDRGLDAMALKDPALRWVGASVRSERLAAQARRQQEAQARESAEEALRAPPPPAPAAPPPNDEEAAAADETGAGGGNGPGGRS